MRPKAENRGKRVAQLMIHRDWLFEDPSLVGLIQRGYVTPRFDCSQQCLQAHNPRVLELLFLQWGKETSSVHPVESWRWFQRSARPPPGRSTR